MSEDQYKKVAEFGRQVNHRIIESIETYDERVHSPSNANRPAHRGRLLAKIAGLKIALRHLRSWLEFYGINVATHEPRDMRKSYCALHKTVPAPLGTICPQCHIDAHERIKELEEELAEIKDDKDEH